VRDLSDEDLAVRFRDTRKSCSICAFSMRQGSSTNPHKLNVTRREIARLLTTIRQRELDRTAAGGEG